MTEGNVNIKYVEKDPDWEFNVSVKPLIELMREEKAYFYLISIVITTYIIPDNSDEIAEERKQDILDLIRANEVLRNRSSEQINIFIGLVDSLFSNERSKDDLGKDRGQLLEAFVYYIGVDHLYSDYDNYIEPYVYSDGQLVGGSKHVIDCLFTQDNISIDFFECKTKLNNFLSYDSNGLTKDNSIKKMNYIKELHTFFEEKELRHEIFIATAVSDVDDYQDLLNRSELGFIKILNNDTLYQKIISI